MIQSYIFKFYFFVHFRFDCHRTGKDHIEGYEILNTCNSTQGCPINSVCSVYGDNPACGTVRRNVEQINDTFDGLGQWCAYNNYMQECIYLCDTATTQEECEAVSDEEFNCIWDSGGLPFYKTYCRSKLNKLPNATDNAGQVFVTADQNATVNFTASEGMFEVVNRLLGAQTALNVTLASSIIDALGLGKNIDLSFLTANVRTPVGRLIVDRINLRFLGQIDFLEIMPDEDADDVLNIALEMAKVGFSARFRLGILPPVTVGINIHNFR